MRLFGTKRIPFFVVEVEVMRKQRWAFRCLLCLGYLFVFLFLGRDVSAQVKQEYWVKMADGTELHTVVLLPGDGTGSWPVLLTRGPYKFDNDFSLVQWGVVKVEQNTRGRFLSKGKDSVFGDDRVDGAETVAWIRKQPWCNGRVATFGGSALGITQYIMADTVGDSLVGQMVWVGASDLYHHTFFSRGGFRQRLVTGWMENQATTNQMPLPHPMLAEFEREQLSGSPFWRARKIQDPSKINLPALHVGGWYDFHAQATLDTFSLYQTQGGPLARGKQHLIMGPWAHDVGRAQIGELTFPAGAETFVGLSLLQLFEGFMDRYLHQKATSSLDRLSPVNVYVMGAVGEVGALGNQWLQAQTWPPPLNQTLRVYLRADKSLSVEEPTSAETSAFFRYDPQNPVPTLGGDNLLIPSGPFDQRSAESRADVLLYSSGPLPEPLLVVGKVKVHLWVATDAKDTDFTAKLTDVYPDGRSMLVMDGVIRLRHRRTAEKEEFVTPETPVEVEIDMGSTAIVFNKGHRIRLAISSSNSPRFAANPNTGDKFSLQPTQTVIAKNTVYHDKIRASYLLLPIPDTDTWLKKNTENSTEKVVSEASLEKSPEVIQDAADVEPSIEKSAVETPASLEEQTIEQAESTKEAIPSEPQPKTGCGCEEESTEGTTGRWLLVVVLLFWLKRRQSQKHFSLR